MITFQMARAQPRPTLSPTPPLVFGLRSLVFKFPPSCSATSPSALPWLFLAARAIPS